MTQSLRVAYDAAVHGVRFDVIYGRIQRTLRLDEIDTFSLPEQRRVSKLCTATSAQDPPPGRYSRLLALLLPRLLQLV